MSDGDSSEGRDQVAGGQVAGDLVAGEKALIAHQARQRTRQVH